MNTGSSAFPEPSDSSVGATEHDADFAGEDVLIAPVMVALNMPADGVPDVVVDER